MYIKKKNKRFGPEMEASAGNKHKGIRSGQQQWGDQDSVHSMHGEEAVAQVVKN